MRRQADRPGGATSASAAPRAASELQSLARSILLALGAPGATAYAVAESLVEANLLGHDSHGVRRLTPYAELVRDGQIDPGAIAEIALERGATAIVNGHRGFGQPAAWLAVEHVTELARSYGVGAVAIRRCNHIGRLGEYVEALAGAGFAALAFCNADPTVAPFGGRERRLGTNPLAWAAPRAGGPPVVMDWATSAVAEGKLAVARARGERVAEGVLVDSEGMPSSDPAAFYAGGALLPFGAHKGSGLSVMIELVGGLLSAAGVSSLEGHGEGNGAVMIGLDPGAFVRREDFEAQAEAFCAELAGTAPARGFDEVLIPGEIERRTRERRVREGVPVPQATWSELCALAESLGAQMSVAT